jgi:hypothetical protein
VGKRGSVPGETDQQKTVCHKNLASPAEGVYVKAYGSSKRTPTSLAHLLVWRTDRDRSNRSLFDRYKYGSLDGQLVCAPYVPKSRRRLTGDSNRVLSVPMA